MALGKNWPYDAKAEIVTLQQGALQNSFRVLVSTFFTKKAAQETLSKNRAFQMN